MKQEKVDITTKIWFIIPLFIILLLNLNNTKYLLDQRYSNNFYDAFVIDNKEEIQTYLIKIGVDFDSKIQAIGDQMPNYLLYILGRKGWTEWVYGHGKVFNEEVLKKRIALGAEYIITFGNEPIERDFLKPYIKHQLGKIGDVRIFKL